MKFQNYINGKWVKGKSAFQTINPANEEIVAEIAQAEISDVDAAVSAAKNAFNAWRLTPAPLRGELLFKVGDILKQKKEELSQLLTRDMGKVIAEARGDVQEAIDMAYFMGGEGRRLLGYTAPVEMMNKFGSCGTHHALEFPDRCAIVENFPCAGCGQHDHLETLARDARHLCRVCQSV